MLNIFVRLCRQIPGLTLKYTLIIDKSRVYQELIYQNDVLKIMLTGLTTPPVPNHQDVFEELFSICFPHYPALVRRCMKRISSVITRTIMVVHCKIKHFTFSD